MRRTPAPIRGDVALEYCLPRGADTLRLRWTNRREMRHLLELSRLRPVACYGDFHKGPPRYGAEQIWVCERA